VAITQQTTHPASALECPEWCAMEGPHDHCMAVEAKRGMEARGPCPSWCCGSHSMIPTANGSLVPSGHPGAGRRIRMKKNGQVVLDRWGIKGHPDFLVNAYRTRDRKTRVTMTVAEGPKWSMTVFEARKLAEALMDAAAEAES
jgi:hypothetical protein